ncbi:YlzJ-like family protein [Gorillibacterium timonense]|uniref:YlzJ-like family protein n=1 Tax=Gorillibacterium timonense TaxID=1689269 RepID=UPI00071C805B|nr:YlzJ-like family protein [Gorillibacterium timonense]
MTLHTILPHELVLAGIEDASYAYQDAVIDGICMQVEFLGSARARIIRLYSANLADYLNPLYAPGTVIHYQPTSIRE